MEKIYKGFTIKQYNDYQFKYGLVTMIALLQHFEEEENFEECSKIVTSISRLSKELGITFETKLTKGCFESMIKTWKDFGIDITEDKLMFSSMLYATDILNEYYLNRFEIEIKPTN
jgi:hypothetical protein